MGCGQYRALAVLRDTFPELGCGAVDKAPEAGDSGKADTSYHCSPMHLQTLDAAEGAMVACRLKHLPNQRVAVIAGSIMGKLGRKTHICAQRLSRIRCGRPGFW